MATEIATEPAPEAPALPPGMPPANEPGFPALPMFAGEVGELFGALQPHTIVQLGSSPADGVMTTGMAMFSEQGAQAQMGTQVVTSRGVLKADLVSHGMLQTSFEGFAPLPFMQFNTQLAFMPQGFAGGVLQGLMLTPVGMLMGCLNTAGQLSAEAFTAVQPTPTSQLILGAHTWGLPGLRCGVKGAIELQHQQVDAKDELVGSSSISLTCVSPFVNADGSALAAPERSTTLSVFHRTSAKHSLAMSLEWPAKAAGRLTVGGTRELSDHTRLRGKWGTSGVLALALEVAGEKSSATLVAEMNAKPDQPLAPKFGATIALNP
jgi:hypothetical protein